MRNVWPLVLISIVGAGCSGSDEPGAKKTEDHVWQVQEDAYRKAQNVDPMLNDADQKQRRELERQGGG